MRVFAHTQFIRYLTKFPRNFALAAKNAFQKFLGSTLSLFFKKFAFGDRPIWRLVPKFWRLSPYRPILKLDRSTAHIKGRFLEDSFSKSTSYWLAVFRDPFYFRTYSFSSTLTPFLPPIFAEKLPENFVFSFSFFERPRVHLRPFSLEILFLFLFILMTPRLGPKLVDSLGGSHIPMY